MEVSALEKGENASRVAAVATMKAAWRIGAWLVAVFRRREEVLGLKKKNSVT
jgi:hypothetical protein